MEQTKKKRHIGRTIFLVILILILLIPVLVFGYLSLCGFHPEKQRAAYDPAAPYAGGRTYAPDGSITVMLSENDIYRLGEEVDINALLADAMVPFVTVSSWSAALQEGGVEICADARLFHFLPVPLKVTADAAFERGTVDLVITEIMLGKWISVPLDMLYKRGLPETIPFTINDGDRDDKIQDIVFLDGAVQVTDRVIDVLMHDFFMNARQVAYTLSVLDLPLPDDSKLIETTADYMVFDMTEAALCRMLAESDDPDATFLSLLAMYGEESSLSLLDSLESFERMYIVPFTEKEIEEERKSILAPIADAQQEYEALLSAVREAYKAGALTLNTSYMIDSETAAPLSLAALAPTLQIDDAACRVLLLHSLDALHAVATSDMPMLADIPKVSAKATGGAYELIPYDIGILMTLPNGLAAILHYEASGVFVVNCIEMQRYNDILSARLQPYLVSDDFPKPPLRVTLDVPGCSPLDLLIAYEVTKEIANAN